MTDSQHQEDMEARQTKFERNAQKEDQAFKNQRKQTTLTKILIRTPTPKQPTPLGLWETKAKDNQSQDTPSGLIMAFINVKKFQTFQNTDTILGSISLYEIDQILQQKAEAIHKDPACAHPGRTKFRKLMGDQYYWPGLIMAVD